MRERITPARLALLVVLLVVPPAYVLTSARAVVYGDPTEYTFVANILGIAHPPGYAFYTLLGKLFQTLLPVGDIPWRMHLLSAAAATTAALSVFGAVYEVTGVLFAATALRLKPGHTVWRAVGALFAALVVAFGVNFWQHAIHANPHIVTAAFMAANLFWLTRWAARGANDPRWLNACALTVGLGVTHHPLTVMSLPAYAIFIVAVRPRILREWRALLGIVACGLLGLAVWLYFPLRSPMQPAFGPSTMNTLGGFLDHVLARGLSESLPFFALADAPARAVVFWTILRLQYALPVIFLALLGLVWPVAERRLRRGAATVSPPTWKFALLYALALLGNLAFVLSLRAQDIMAYILGPMLVVGLLAGIGLYGLLVMVAARLRLATTPLALLAAALFLLGPGLQLARNAPRVSLRNYTEAADYTSTVFNRFAGTGEGATLLNDWEHMTPLWYAQFVERRGPAAADVRPVLVSTAQPWLESVFATLPGGPVYLSNYRREIVDAGFRLRPDGPFYRVVEPGDDTLPAGLEAVETGGDAPAEVQIVAYDLPRQDVATGDYVALTLALRALTGTAAYVVPVVRAADVEFAFTTDSHVTSPEWQPGEIIVERFDFALPHDLPGGAYPLSVTLRNLSDGSETTPVALGELNVTGRNNAPDYDFLLANFRQRVGLVSATARMGLARRSAVWDEPLAARPGDTVHLLLQWQALARAEESYTVFVHLIDGANRPLLTLDYTPLGGSAPTHLWIPKWLPGQRLLDPYRLRLPDDLPPGRYYIEVGLYEMVGRRRLHMADGAGNTIGDRLILGPVDVEN